jgi:hypothetical protein
MAIFSGRRIRDNNVQGTITDAPLTNVATTLNSAGLANLSAVSSNHAVIVLDPLRAAGAPEIVIVTAHTGAATSATITRGAYGTSARQHAAGTLWVHPAIDADLIEILTADPSDFYEGQLWYRSDTDIFMAHNGTAAVEALPIGGWQSYTPTLTQSATPTKTTNYAKYTRLGRLIIVELDLSVTSSGTAGTAVSLGLPVAAAYTASALTIGGGGIFDNSTAITYTGEWGIATSTTVSLYHDQAFWTAWGVNPSLALASGDRIRAHLMYEAAA